MIVFDLLPYLLYFMRFSPPTAFWLCAEVSYLARFPHSTACLIGCASLIFKVIYYHFSLVHLGCILSICFLCIFWGF